VIRTWALERHRRDVDDLVVVEWVTHRGPERIKPTISPRPLSARFESSDQGCSTRKGTYPMVVGIVDISLRFGTVSGWRRELSHGALGVKG